MTFAAPLNFDAGDAPYAIAMADFDADGDLDLAVANEGSDNVSVLIGARDGTFAGPINYAVAASPRSIATADFDGDGDPDLAVPSHGTGTTSILIGGTGSTFSAGTSLGGGDQRSGIATGDFNGDLDPDLAISDRGDYVVSIRLGSAGATFATAPSLTAGAEPAALAIADFNSDTDPDLAVTNSFSDDVSTLLGAAGGTFTGPTNTLTADGPRSITAGDFTGDGDPDLAIAHGSGAVSVLLGGPGGSFTGPTNFPAGTEPSGVASGDLDSDGALDLVVANHQSDNVSVLLGGPGGTFTGPSNFPAGDGPRAVALGDADGDGDLDAVVANLNFDNVSVLLNTTDLTPPETTIDSGPDAPINNPAPVFAFSASEPGSTFDCRFDGHAFAACSSPLAPGPLPQGAHTFEVRATDTAGNADATPARRSFTIDTSAPAVTIGGPARVIVGDSASFTASVADPGGAGVDPAAVLWTPGGGLAEARGTTATWSFTRRGPYVLRVRAVDRAGNVSTEAALTVTAQLPPLITAGVTNAFDLLRGGKRRRVVAKRVTDLTVTRLPAKARVRVTCKPPRRPRSARRSCAFSRKTIAVPTAKRALPLAKLFKRRRLVLRTVIRVTVTAPAVRGKVLTYRITRARTTAARLTCVLPDGAAAPCT